MPERVECSDSAPVHHQPTYWDKGLLCREHADPSDTPPMQHRVVIYNTALLCANKHNAGMDWEAVGWGTLAAAGRADQCEGLAWKHLHAPRRGSCSGYALHCMIWLE